MTMMMMAGACAGAWGGGSEGVHAVRRRTGSKAAMPLPHARGAGTGTDLPPLPHGPALAGFEEKKARGVGQAAGTRGMPAWGAPVLPASCRRAQAAGMRGAVPAWGAPVRRLPDMGAGAGMRGAVPARVVPCSTTADRP